MSSNMSSQYSQAVRPHRVLACTRCQQRKVKCDRSFPCMNCIKSKTTCVPSKLVPRQRRRKIPERALLERLHNYENLLRQNNITFEQLDKDSFAEKEPLDTENGNDSDGGPSEAVDQERSASATPVKSEGGYEARNIWRVMSQGFRDPGNESDSSHDDVRETTMKKAWDQSATTNDHLLFGSRTNGDLSSLHPDPVQIFRLWQIYLDNVNPILKVTHTPSLQGRIIEAASHMTDINSTLEALMFSVYCMAVLSLTGEECFTMLGSSREDLLQRYQFGCQQALLNSEFLRTSDRDCLTALYLYLITIRFKILPQSLSSTLGVAIRIALRMGINNEAALAKCDPFEAEMRRRLWWSLVLFDTRMSEIANSNTTNLDPTWDCKIPLNVNDSDLRPEMKIPPSIQGTSTEALFAVVRSDIGDYIRQTAFHLDYTNPALRPLSKHLQHDPSLEGSEVVKLEQLIDSKYLTSCDPENAIHFMTIWNTRGWLAKCRLLEHHSKLSKIPTRRTDAQHDIASSYALTMLDCDTKIMTSPLTRSFRWQNQCYFPFLGYIQLIQDLRRRPLSAHARQAWMAMGDNYEAAIDSHIWKDSPFFRLFVKIVLQAWEAFETASKQTGEPPMALPKMVALIRRILALLAQQRVPEAEMELSSISIGTQPVGDYPMSLPSGFADQNWALGMGTDMGMPYDYTLMGQEMYGGVPPLDMQLDQLDWMTMGG